MNPLLSTVLLLIIVIGVFVLDCVHPDSIKDTNAILLFVLGHFTGKIAANEENAKS